MDRLVGLLRVEEKHACMAFGRLYMASAFGRLYTEGRDREDQGREIDENEFQVYVPSGQGARK